MLQESHHVTESIAQKFLELCQAWCCDHLPRKPVQLPTTLWGKSLFLIFSLKLPWNLVPFRHIEKQNWSVFHAFSREHKEAWDPEAAWGWNSEGIWFWINLDTCKMAGVSQMELSCSSWHFNDVEYVLAFSSKQRSRCMWNWNKEVLGDRGQLVWLLIVIWLCTRCSGAVISSQSSGLVSVKCWEVGLCCAVWTQDGRDPQANKISESTNLGSIFFDF